MTDKNNSDQEAAGATLWRSTYENKGISIKVAEHLFPSYPIILAADSLAFDSLLLSRLEENIVDLSDMENEGVKELLDFLYQGNADKNITTFDVAHKLFKLAREYEILSVGQAAISKLINEINNDNVMLLLETTERYPSTLLRQRVVSHIVENRADIINTVDFQLFAEKHSHVLLEIVETCCESIQDKSSNNQGVK
ncbi:speckle-type POZ protein-like A [Microplitis demolitor]|uniref:speckle-type POZ protein-like A n=1 Tax=Microplitis demolitor TaxID=69319 RepID=UPI0006D51314|nr:speckle-type POZ protein-like A [Microplitis demolitor]